jgi:hypothetical protein
MRLVSELAGGGFGTAAAAAGQQPAPAAALKGLHITPQRVFAALLNLAHQSNTAAWAAARQQRGSGGPQHGRPQLGAAPTHMAWLPGCSVELAEGAGGEVAVVVLPVT